MNITSTATTPVLPPPPLSAIPRTSEGKQVLNAKGVKGEGVNCLSVLTHCRNAGQTKDNEKQVTTKGALSPALTSKVLLSLCNKKNIPSPATDVSMLRIAYFCAIAKAISVLIDSL